MTSGPGFSEKGIIMPFVDQMDSGDGVRMNHRNLEI